MSNAPRIDQLAKTNVVSVNSQNYTITAMEGTQTILVTTGSSQRTITLPSVSLSAGRTITIKKVDSGSGTVLIDTPGSETIDGVAQKTVTSQYGFITLTSDGSNWSIVNIFDALSYVYATGDNQSCGGSQIIAFNTETIDTKNEYSGGVFTAKQAGMYCISTILRVDSGTPNYEISLRKNGSNLIRTSMGTPSQNWALEAIAQLAVGDTLDVYLVYYSGPTNLTASLTIQNVVIRQLPYY